MYIKRSTAKLHIKIMSKISVSLLLVAACSLAAAQMIGGPRPLSQKELDDPRYTDLINAALAVQDPCLEVAELLRGTSQVVNGVKYQFHIRLAVFSKDPQCVRDQDLHGALADYTIIIPAISYTKQ